MNRRLAVVGTIWGLLDAFLLVVPLYLYGTSLTSTHGSTSLLYPRVLFTGYTFGPLPAFPVGWLVLGVSFILAFAIADVRRAVKALCLSEVIAFAVSPLILIIFSSSLTSLSGEGMIAFFSFVAVVFFLLGVVGGVFGSFLGAWIEENPGRFNFSLSRHRTLLVVAILIFVIGTSSFVMASLVSAQIQSAAGAANSTRSIAVIVADQTFNWSMGVENVNANFVRANSSNPGGGDRIIVGWSSNLNVSFHVMLQGIPGSIIQTVNSCGGALYSNSCSFGCDRTYCGQATVDLVGSTIFYYGGTTGYTYAWFHNDACSVSGCPAGLVHYLITMYTYY